MRTTTLIAIAAATVAGTAGTALAATSPTNSSTANSSTASRSGSVTGSGATARAVWGKGPAAVGLTSQQHLVLLATGAPAAPVDLGTPTGLKGDQTLVGIDQRVQDHRVYGVGDKGGIYTLDLRHHAGNTLQAAGKGVAARKVSQLSVPLSGRLFGVDFNPAANRLRVISDTGQNLRHNIDDPAGVPAKGVTAVDGALTNPPPPGSTTPVPAAGVTAAAYTNNDTDAATATTLFDIDTTGDQVSIQSPANAGNLAPTGKLGLDAATDAGFDIHTAKNGTNTGYAALKVGDRTSLYRIDLLNGHATRTGTFPARHQVTDLTILH